jgi:nucleotide-binding universal stress UspA family protein
VSTETILCPVRGGKRSDKTVARAIELALGKNATLAFLYVVDVEFLGHATVARVKLMIEELTETGKFALTRLAERAQAAGVEQVEAIIREGKIEDVVRRVLETTGASVLVTGRPGQTPNVVSFSEEAFGSFMQSLQETGVEIERVE